MRLPRGVAEENVVAHFHCHPTTGQGADNKAGWPSQEDLENAATVMFPCLVVTPRTRDGILPPQQQEDYQQGAFKLVHEYEDRAPASIALNGSNRIWLCKR